jgi:hypothetical protein
VQATIPPCLTFCPTLGLEISIAGPCDTEVRRRIHGGSIKSWPSVGARVRLLGRRQRNHTFSSILTLEEVKSGVYVIRYRSLVNSDLYTGMLCYGTPDNAMLYNQNDHECPTPNGVNILSLTTLLATSPPFSNANAPTIAYNVCVRTASSPEPVKLSACACTCISGGTFSVFQDYTDLLRLPSYYSL